jgi:quercetin dioxygenase-like cupin family protein
MAQTSLTVLARQQLERARSAAHGRSAHTVYAGPVLRQILIALAGGQRLDEHENPGEATVHVLNGQVRLVAGDASWTGSAGDLLVVPDTRHSVEALEDAVILLTIVKRG